MTEEQRKHYEMLIKRYGQPPEGTTHFSMLDSCSSSWRKLEESGDCFFWWDGDAGEDRWHEFLSGDYRVSCLVPIPTELVDAKFVCVELDSDEAVVGDLDTILYWQKERNIPARRCIYYTVGEEVDFKDIVKQSRSE